MRALASPLGRGAYLGWGVGLSVAKIGVDFAIARAFGHAWSFLYYVSPIDAPLLQARGDWPYWVALASAALPFVAAGVALTTRRLRDAGMSPWLALLFFAPFANILFFLVCALAPRVDPPRLLPAEEGAYRAPPAPIVLAGSERSARATTWIAAGLGAVVGLGTLALSVGLLKEYGAALFLGAPTISGFATGAFYARMRPGARFRSAAGATAISLALTLGILIAFAIEGVVCLVMALPLLAAPAFLGAFIGFESFKGSRSRGAPRAIGISIVLLPMLALAEHASPLPAMDPPPVETEITIDASPARVWREIASMPTMPEPDELLFRAGIAYPIRATLDAEAVGATRRCDFSTGTVLETVQTWAPGERLVFRIDAQPDPMREATLWAGPRQPHLGGAVKNVLGELVLEPLDGGKRTRLVGRSWYRVSLAPEAYWRVWSDVVVHAIHRRVMKAAKGRAEAASVAPLAVR